MPWPVPPVEHYPLRVNTAGAPFQTTAQSGSGVYFLAQRAAGAPAATFRMVDPGGGNVGFPWPEYISLG